MTMPRSILCLFLLWGTVAALPAQTAPVLTSWDRVVIAPMKTSIYVGSVTLSTEVLVRSGSTLSTTYEAKVRPWFFWSETGQITITLTDAAQASLARGERAEFTGEATNQKKKSRAVTGYAQPVDSTSGKIKVRIMADGVELVFNGTYKFESSGK